MQIDIPDEIIEKAKSALILKRMVRQSDIEKDPLDRLVVYVVGYYIKQKKIEKGEK